MTFPDPGTWQGPQDLARPHEAADELPPLPTLAPLPTIRPMAPMPAPPWESGPSGVTQPVPPPPPAGHPAAAPVVAPPPPSQPTPVQPPPSVQPPLPTQATAPSQPAVVSHHHAPDPPSAAPSPAAPRTSAPHAVAGRHASLDPRAPRGAPLGRHVLVLGGIEPLGSMVAERLTAAGHLLAVANVAVPTDISPRRDQGDTPLTIAEPIALDTDRFDADEIVRTVARAEVALGGLDALVVLPASAHLAVSIDADAATWADEWSSALTAEVLAAACASHIAARSFLARRRSGRIILVTDGRGATNTRPTSAARAALAQLGADLSEELGPHGIGVSVVAGAGDFGVGQVADVVEALLSTPVLTSVSARIG